MISDIRKLLENKRILILGFGKEGKASYSLIREVFPEAILGIADRSKQLSVQNPHLSNDTHLSLHDGKDYLKSCAEYDMVIKSPGIPYDMVVDHCEAGNLTSQTDLFLQLYSERVTGVTGTKGKSTTTTLIHHIMRHAGRKVVLSGNIGIPPLSLVKEIDDDTEIIFEMSSHQLERINRSPQTAVLLNIFPEHLDHYKDFTAYKMAKFNIHHMQGNGSLLVYNADDPLIQALAESRQDDITYRSFSTDKSSGADAYLTQKDIVIDQKDGLHLSIPLNKIPDLPGRHNLMNLMAASLVCLQKGLDIDQILEAINDYKRPEHRLEYVGIYRGISFYNDSIATIPEAVIEALNTLKSVDLLILGGHDRGLEYKDLYQRLEAMDIPHLIFMGDAGRRMYSEAGTDLSRHASCYIANSMEEVFMTIKDKLVTGDVCLLSPAAASYGMFRDFEERGQVYKKMAAAL